MRNHLRTCRYKDENYLFHCFEQYANVVGASALVGGHPGGQVSQVFALIEDESGNIKRVDPTEIRFTDKEFRNYSNSCSGKMKSLDQ